MSSEIATLLTLAGYFALLSLFAIGGANAALPEMHRLAVEVMHWMSDRQFADMFAIAQVTPGPNVIVVTLIGYHVAGLAGALVATASAGPEAPAPVPVTDRAQFLPNRKHQALPGKVVGVLALGDKGLLNAEGVKGPEGVHYLSLGGYSYRWLYLPVKQRPLIGGLNVRVGEQGQTHGHMKDDKSNRKRRGHAGQCGEMALDSKACHCDHKHHKRQRGQRGGE